MLNMNAPTALVRRRIPTAIGSLLAIGLLASACGGAATDDGPSVAALPADSSESAAATDENSEDTDDAPVNPEDVSDEDVEAAQFRYDQCMIDNGVDTQELFGDVEDGGSVMIEAGDDFEAEFEAYEAANEECQPILEEVFGDFSFSPEQEAEFADIEAKFNQCMTDKGFPISSGDGDSAGGGIGFEIETESADDFEELESAMDECDKVFEESDLFQTEPAEVDQ